MQFTSRKCGNSFAIDRYRLVILLGLSVVLYCEMMSTVSQIHESSPYSGYEEDPCGSMAPEVQ
jgi:hypothetical protein